MRNIYKGSCLCNTVRFEIAGEPASFFLCHCTRCRKDTGSAHAANLFFKDAKISWLSGQENVAGFTLPATRHTRSFCKHCGSALPSEQMDGSLLVVPAGCLDDDITIKPNAHIFCADKANWDNRLHEISSFETLPD